MIRFYDPRDDKDLARVQDVLRKGGIEFFLQREEESSLGKSQILVAEEDLPRAEALVVKMQRH